MPKSKSKKRQLVVDSIEKKIFLVRGHRVMMSSDLASLYAVAPKALIQAVKRNRYRFPSDFMFQLNSHEFQNLKSQSVTSSWGGLRRALPYAFTEQGVAMLSSVLRSRRAIEVNIQIIRTFVQFKQAFLVHKELAEKLSVLEKQVGNHDREIQEIFEAIKRLIVLPEKPKRRIGFHVDPQDLSWDPFKHVKLTKYEREIEAAFERGEYKDASKEDTDRIARILRAYQRKVAKRKS